MLQLKLVMTINFSFLSKFRLLSTSTITQSKNNSIVTVWGEVALLLYSYSEVKVKTKLIGKGYL